MNASTSGAWGELVVAAVLLEREWAVFRAVSPSAPCDLVAHKGDQLIRIEVRTGRTGPKGLHWRWHPQDTIRSDWVAVVLPASEQVRFFRSGRPGRTEEVWP